MRTTERRDRGSALLAVLWLSAALAAIAFSLSTTVRGETERSATAVDDLRCYYLATGAIERAWVELLWSITNPSNRAIPKGSIAIDYAFPSGVARVEFFPEAGKLDVNHAPVEELTRLLLALGIDAARAQDLAAAIDEARRPAAGAEPAAVPFASSFQPRHASFEEIEDLLLVNGITPDMFYGTYVPEPSQDSGTGGAVLAPRGGLMDCLTVYGSGDRVDANTAPPAVLAAVGLSPFAIHALLERRRGAPLTEQTLFAFMQSIGADPSRLRLEGNSMLTIRATARLRLPNGQLSDLKRTVAAQMRYMPLGTNPPVHILRWYNTAWSN